MELFLRTNRGQQIYITSVMGGALCVLGTHGLWSLQALGMLVQHPAFLRTGEELVGAVSCLVIHLLRI